MSALGKGLGSLIPTRSKKDEVNYQSSDAIFDNEKIEHIPIDKIAANPWQPRTHFDRDKLEELAQSIKQHGILQPLVVSKEGNFYQLIAGERRLRAHQKLNKQTIEVIVIDASDEDAAFHAEQHI